MDLGHILFHYRQYDRSLEQFRKVLDLDPNYWFARHSLGRSYTYQGRYAEAVAEFQKARLVEDNPAPLGGLGTAYAMSGQTDAARKVLDELLAISQRRYVRPYDVAMIYVALGDKDQAFAWLEKGYADRHGAMAFLKITPAVDGLRADPRFADLMRRMGFPP